ncbi:hypothetical protein PABG_04593 [Paracoccidioides brasiliensis Pb03]|nr:hypothetical protein PABG_04593 [Paracoccidioides brasiliensis Pb03]
MVRFKHRYLLIDILYPPSSDVSSTTPSAAKTEPKPPPRSTSSSTANANANLTTHLLIHRPTPDTLTPQSLARAVREHIAETFGDWGMGRLGGGGAGSVSVKYLSPATSTAIIRCPRASYRLVWCALTYMSRLPASRGGGGGGRANANLQMQDDCVFRVVRVSGTMRKAEEEAISRARREVVRMRVAGEKGGGMLEGMFGGEVEVGVDVDVDMGENEQEDEGSDED